MQAVLSRLLLGLLLAGLCIWTGAMLFALGYYGAYVIAGSTYPRGGEAQIGAAIGFIYSIPGLVALSGWAWFCRARLPRPLLYLPGTLLLVACIYFGYLYFLASAVSQS